MTMTHFATFILPPANEHEVDTLPVISRDVVVLSEYCGIEFRNVRVAIKKIVGAKIPPPCVFDGGPRRWHLLRWASA